MARVDIVRRDDGTVEFQPPSQTVLVGDTVFWRNLDPRDQHWITRSDQSRTFWFSSPLAPFVAGQPGDTTDGVLFESSGSVAYRCDLHPEEQGVIVIKVG